MDMTIAGKVALVTGSSRGIGRAIAIALHQEGCKLVLNGRNGDSLQEAVDELPGSVAVRGDVQQKEEAVRIVAAATAAFGGLDIVVCNVGGGRSVPPGTETATEWQRMFALNLWSATNVVEAAVGELERRAGNIVCISSICGVEMVPDAPLTYSCAKAALNAYVRGAARPLGRRHVRINAVVPGNILVDDSVWARKLTEDSEVLQKMLDREVSLRRLGTPEEVADLVVYLASPRAAFATGGVWTLDGGQLRS